MMASEWVHPRLIECYLHDTTQCNFHSMQRRWYPTPEPHQFPPPFPLFPLMNRFNGTEAV
jgi:hypothetical protein